MLGLLDKRKSKMKSKDDSLDVSSEICPFCRFDHRRKCVNWGKVRFSETTASPDGKSTQLTERQYKKWRNEACKDRQILMLQAELNK